MHALSAWGFAYPCRGMGRRMAKPRIVLLSIAAAAALAACVQPLATVVGDASKDEIRAITQLVTSGSVASQLAPFNTDRCVTTNPTGVLSAEASIVSAFQSWGYAVTKSAVTVDRAFGIDPSTGGFAWVDGPFTMDNLIAEKPGTDPSLRPVFLSAHYDTMPGTPGADDNGSGCAGVMEAARVLQAISLRRTVRFIIFGFEEEGLVGSSAYANSLSDADLPESVLNIETAGFTSAREGQVIVAGSLLGLPKTGDFIGAFGSSRSRALTLDCLSAAQMCAPDLKVYAASADSNLSSDPFLRDILRSDQTPFWERGVPAIMFTDTANLREGSPYHTSQDDVTRIDFEFLTNVIRTAIAVLCIRAGI